jgi:RND family efflux transporter MFP subunit
MTNPHGRPPLSGREKFALTVAAIVFLGASIFVASYMMTHRPKPQRRKPTASAPIVKVSELTASSQNVTIPVQGTVVPAAEVDLKARVGGEVTWTHPELIEGGLVKKGQTLVRLDPVDYELALIGKKAILESAIYDLKDEQGRQEIAKSEWEILGLDEKASELDLELALRQPQLAAKQAQLEAAQAEVRQAELALERTVIKAPFNAVIRSVEIDVGSQITTQSILAHLVGSDAFHIKALVPLDRLRWIILPDGPLDPSSSASVNTSTGRVREGRILKLMGDLEPNGRLARLLIEVKDPIDLEKKNGDRSPMFLGDFVSVLIQGRTVDNVFVIDRNHLKDGTFILTVNNEDRLIIEEIDLVWQGQEEVLVTGITPGTRMVISDLSAPVEGMKVRIQGDNDTMDTEGKVKSEK